jgi:hypothetical protein
MPILLLVALPAYGQPTFTELLDEAATQYKQENYLSVKSLIMKATANLNKRLTDQLEKGELSFFLFQEELSQLMDIQFKEWRTDFLGKEVIWQGWVVDVKKEWYGGYTVLLEMDGPDIAANGYDISLALSSNQKELALSLQKGAELKFKGNISDIRKSSGRVVVIIKSVEIL